MPSHHEIAARVRQLREKHGSHDKLAAKLGTSRQRIIAHEKSGKMQRPLAERYARITGTEPEDWLQEGKTVTLPEEALLNVVRRLEAIADRLADFDDPTHPQSE